MAAMIRGMTETIADRIRLILKRNDWSERELAQRAGYRTPSQVNNTLKRLDRDPSAIEVATIKKIAAGAKVSARWLQFGGPEDSAIEGVMDASDPDAVDDRSPDEDSSVLEIAVVRAFDPTRHTIADLDAVRGVVRAMRRWDSAGMGDPVSVMGDYLDAAAGLRRHNVQADATNLLQALTFGSTPHAIERAEAAGEVANKLMEDAAKVAGVEKTGQAEKARALLAKNRAKQEPRE